MSWPTKKLKMNRNETQKYCVKNQYAAMRFFNASDDYVAARCCILNGLFPGFTLASQAIEKMLKACIFLESKKELKRGHNPFELKEELKKLKDYGLNKYDNLLKKLYDHYLARYHEDNVSRHEDGTSGASSDELIEIDELYLEITNKLPMPDEVKYRTKFFADLFENNPYWNNQYWITIKNQALKKQINAMKKRYKEVFQHLYGK